MTFSEHFGFDQYTSNCSNAPHKYKLDDMQWRKTLYISYSLVQDFPKPSTHLLKIFLQTNREYKIQLTVELFYDLLEGKPQFHAV